MTLNLYSCALRSTTRELHKKQHAVHEVCSTSRDLQKNRSCVNQPDPKVSIVPHTVPHTAQHTFLRDALVKLDGVCLHMSADALTSLQKGGLAFTNESKERSMFRKAISHYRRQHHTARGDFTLQEATSRYKRRHHTARGDITLTEQKHTCSSSAALQDCVCRLLKSKAGT